MNENALDRIKSLLLNSSGGSFVWCDFKYDSTLHQYLDR